MQVIPYILAKKYTDKSIEGISGVLAGKNCKIASSTKTDGVTTIVFEWTADNGDTRTTQIQVADGETPEITITPITGGHRVTFTTDGTPQTVDIMDGVSVVSAEIKSNNHLELTLSDGTKIDCGEIVSAKELDDLTDVNLGTLSDGDVLAYDEASGKWINREINYEIAVEDLTDVNINKSTLVDGDIIKWDATAQKWVKGQIPTIDSLNDVGDVDLTSPTNGQILVYDDTDDKWKNVDNTIVADIDDLGDVDIDTTTLENGQILKYDSVSHKWVNGNASATSTKIEDLADVSVDTTTLEDGMVLVWDATNQVWVNQQGGGVINKLDDIGDVNLTNITDGQIIVWNALAQKWINADIATNLSELTDVSLGALSNLDLLRYNLTRQRWENYSADEVVTENSTNVVTSGATFDAIEVVSDKLGDLATLKTTDKTTVVNALNEVYDALADLTTNVGDITLLTTTDKTSVVNAINELVTTIGALKYLEQISTMPLASTMPNKIVEYIGSDTVDYTRGYVYRSTPYVESGEVVYTWVRVDVQPNNDDYESLSNKPQINSVELVGDKSLDDLGINGKFQYDVLPTATSELTGKVLQYIGGTTADYTTNYFYQCVYDGDTSSYIWKNVDVSSNKELLDRILTLETNQGDMTQLTIPSVTDLVGAINVLSVRGIKSITYVEPYLTITLMDDSTFNFDITIILNATDLGDLGNVLDSTIQDTNLLQYDASLLKYKPYDVVGALVNTLNSSKEYTDQEILKVNTASAIVVDAKPTYDASTNTVVYYKDGQVHVSDKPETRFYYTDSVSGDSFCVSWIDGTEFEYNVAQVDYDDFVSKTNDVVSTYTTTMVDKNKIPNISAMDALYAIIATALGLKVNTADIVDSLLSDDATVPLSAKQGKVLNLKFDDKQDVIQYATLPQVTAQMVSDGVIYQYVGADSQAYKNGRFYKASYDQAQDIYYWKEVKFSADYDAQVLENSTNAPQGGAVYTALQDKQNKTLDTAIAIEGTTEVTVERALSQLNTAKARKFQVLTMPQASADLLGVCLLYVGTSTQTYTQGCFYDCQLVVGSDPSEYEWVNITPKVTSDATMSNTSTNPIQNQAITNGLQALQNGVVIFYPSESDRLDEVSYASGQIVAVGTICYCVAEHSWYQVTAINSSTLAVTWTSYNPHLSGTYNANDFAVNASTDEVSLLPNRRIYTGSHTQWNALTLTEKAKYAFVAFDDDATMGQGDTRKQDKQLSTPVTIGGVEYATVETALDRLAEVSASAFMHTEG